MTSSVRAGGGVTVDVRDVRAFAKRLRAIDAKLYGGLRLAIKAAGNRVAEDARRRAAYSSRIPGSIRVRGAGLASVAVVAGGPDAPEAAVLEVGNTRHGQSRGPIFRHPVFGHRDRWVDQKTQPFLVPAAQARQEEVAALVAEAVSAVLDRL